MNKQETMPRLSDADFSVLKSQGIVLKRAFFPPDQIRRMRETSLRLRDNSRSHRLASRKWLLTNPWYALKKCFNPNVRKDLYYLSNVTQGCGFPEFSKKYYNQDIKLDHIMSIESPLSNDAIIPWHTDANSTPNSPQPPDNFTLKYFIYLNDIDAANGAFSFMPGTHRLVTLLRQGIINAEIPYYRTTVSHTQGSPMYSKSSELPDLNQALRDPKIINYLLKFMPQNEIDTYAAEIKQLGDDSIEIDKYVLSGPAGTLLVFDDRGLHRGGVPRQRERSILRFNYMPTCYWRKRHSRLANIANMVSQPFLPKILANHWSIK